MNIPPKYEDVVAQLEAERARVTDYIAQRAQTELQLEVAMADLTQFKNVYIAATTREVALQQRLTVAEQLLREALCHAQRMEPISISLFNRIDSAIDAALKPAEEATGSTCNQIREESGLPTKNPCVACNNGACIDR